MVVLTGLLRRDSCRTPTIKCMRPGETVSSSWSPLNGTPIWLLDRRVGWWYSGSRPGFGTHVYCGRSRRSIVLVSSRAAGTRVCRLCRSQTESIDRASLRPTKLQPSHLLMFDVTPARQPSDLCEPRESCRAIAFHPNPIQTIPTTKLPHPQQWISGGMKEWNDRSEMNEWNGPNGSMEWTE